MQPAKYLLCLFLYLWLYVSRLMYMSDDKYKRTHTSFYNSDSKLCKRFCKNKYSINVKLGKVYGLSNFVFT